MLSKLCPRCGKKILMSEKYCNECNDKIVEDKKQSYKRYKARRDDLKEQRFYCTKEWNMAREIVKARDYGSCRICQSQGNIINFDVVHHIIELKEDWNKRTNKNNLICLCDKCHSKVHDIYNTDKKRDMHKFLITLIK